MNYKGQGFKESGLIMGLVFHHNGLSSGVPLYTLIKAAFWLKLQVHFSGMATVQKQQK